MPPAIMKSQLGRWKLPIRQYVCDNPSTLVAPFRRDMGCVCQHPLERIPDTKIRGKDRRLQRRDLSVRAFFNSHSTGS